MLSRASLLLITLTSLALTTAASWNFQQALKDLSRHPFIDVESIYPTPDRHNSYEYIQDEYRQYAKDYNNYMMHSLEADPQASFSFYLAGSTETVSYFFLHRTADEYIRGEISYKYQSPEDLNGRGFDFMIYDLAKKKLEYSCNIKYVWLLHQLIPKGEYLMIFRNKQDIPRHIKVDIVLQTPANGTPAKASDKISESAQLKEMVNGLAHAVQGMMKEHDEDLTEMKMHAEYHSKSYDQQLVNTVLETCLVAILNLIQLYFYRRLFQIKTII